MPDKGRPRPHEHGWIGGKREEDANLDCCSERNCPSENTGVGR